MIAVCFPGQGSQVVGMGADINKISSAAREVFKEADAVLKDAGLPKPLSKLCFEGPDELLRQTEIAQPALLAVGYALYRAGQAILGPLGLCAGHSLGEYGAMIVAGGIEFKTALRLVRRRGELMRDAAAQRPGTMAAVLNLKDEQVAALCAEAPGVVVPANYNSPGQVVISGEPDAVAAVVAAAKAAGGRAMPLKVSGAFHSPLMESAAVAMRAELEAVEIRDSALAVIQNVNAEPTTSAQQFVEGLAAQITGSVRWTQSVETMVKLGVTEFIEFGPGTVLTGLVKRIAPGLSTYNVNSMDSADGLAAYLT